MQFHLIIKATTKTGINVLFYSPDFHLSQKKQGKKLCTADHQQKPVEQPRGFHQTKK
jgi:hypothetical protein